MTRLRPVFRVTCRRKAHSENAEGRYITGNGNAGSIPAISISKDKKEQTMFKFKVGQKVIFYQGQDALDVGSPEEIEAIVRVRYIEQ